LEAGARLHGLGGHVDDDPRGQRVAHDIVLSHELAGFTVRERDVIASLAMFARNKAKVDRIPAFNALDPDTKRGTLILASLLRVADGLDDSKSQTTRIVRVTTTPVVEVGVAGDRASQDAGRANKKADLWLKVMEQPLTVRVENPTEPAEDVPAQRAQPITANDTIGYAGRAIVSHQFDKLRGLEAPLRANVDAEAVHDMRVALRRINSALRLFRPYLPGKPLKKIRPFLEELRDTLGAARNLDVLCADLEKFRMDTGGTDASTLEPLARAWAEERAAAQRSLVKVLDGPDYEEWTERMAAFVKSKERSRTPRVSIVVPPLVWEQYGAVRSRDFGLDDSTLEGLHALRIRIKRLRYTLEFFRAPLEAADEPGESPPESSDLIKPLVALQDQLGAIQDAVVAGQMLTAFIAHQASEANQHGELAPDFQGIAAYHSRVQKRIGEYRQGLPELWAVVISPEYRQLLARAVAGL
jgi:CHAD domain-containing protein